MKLPYNMYIYIHTIIKFFKEYPILKKKKKNVEYAQELLSI